MNLLEQYLIMAKLDPIDAMNQLQDAGIISDNCVWPQDVATGDCVKAIQFLNCDDILWI